MVAAGLAIGFAIDGLFKLSTGDQVPADGTLLSSEGLEIDESLLTGEADPVNKNAKDAALSGSIVVAGQGYMRTTAVGADAYAYKIAAQAKEFKIARSELVAGTNKLLGYISIVILVVGPILVWGSLRAAAIRGRSRWCVQRRRLMVWCQMGWCCLRRWRLC